MSQRRTKPAAAPMPGQGEEALAPIRVDPNKYTAPVVLSLAEIAFLQQALGNLPLQGTPDQLEGLLPLVRTVRGKLNMASQVIQQSLPKPKPRK